MDGERMRTSVAIFIMFWRTKKIRNIVNFFQKKLGGGELFFLKKEGEDSDWDKWIPGPGQNPRCPRRGGQFFWWRDSGGPQLQSGGNEEKRLSAAVGNIVCFLNKFLFHLWNKRPLGRTTAQQRKFEWRQNLSEKPTVLQKYRIIRQNTCPHTWEMYFLHFKNLSKTLLLDVTVKNSIPLLYDVAIIILYTVIIWRCYY